MVGRYGPCGGLALVAPPAQRASLAACSPVHGGLGDEAAVRPRVDGVDALHVLPHRADVVVPLLVVVQVLQAEDVLAVARVGARLPGHACVRSGRRRT